MKVYTDLDRYEDHPIPSVLTIGTFDGVHIGHQKIIERLNQLKSANERSMILTFDPHPRQVIDQSNSIKMLNTSDEKKHLLETFGLDQLMIIPFTKEFSRLTALEFVRDILVNKLHVKKLVIGYDHQFGKNREGNFEQLVEFSELYGFEVERIPAQEIKDVSVSSTKIRNALEEGDINTANKYLGYAYKLSGEIVSGKGLGRTIDFPTINMKVDESNKLIPKKGVYVVKTKIDGATIYGIMNIGYRPTVGGIDKTIEIHLLDFEGNLYGKSMRISVLRRLRDEKKFDSIDALSQQIKADEKAARNWIESIK